MCISKVSKKIGMLFRAASRLLDFFFFRNIVQRLLDVGFLRISIASGGTKVAESSQEDDSSCQWDQFTVALTVSTHSFLETDLDQLELLARREIFFQSENREPPIVNFSLVTFL